MTVTTDDTGAYVASLMTIDKSALPPDGGARFNRLIFSRSPYLLQHAENPVDWYEWGEAAFERARAENLPILLSIGYATCHWCHVMAHESFEDSEVAALLNSHFVCIKVDREERPDIDDFYMTVSQLLTGSGGWPLNIFMSPDKRPFMAITYLPRRKRGGMSGLMELSANIATLWRQQPDRIENNCRGIMEALGNLRGNGRPVRDPDMAAVAGNAFNHLKNIYDSTYGGFGSAPKFPMPIYLGWLIEQGAAGNMQALEMALFTLRQMRNGGIWDQLGGGLHRYSVDREWLAPHFEKMLYDQAMLAWVALDALQATGDLFFSGMAEEIFSFVERELRAAEGAFCSALDADSEGVEGKFYLWDRNEIEDCLAGDTGLFCRFHDVSEKGNFEGRNILNIPLTLPEFCFRESRDEAETERVLESCRALLLLRRNSRIRPLRDDKIIVSWNGLMIAALARGGAVCGREAYVTQASAAARFILNNMRRTDGRLLRSYLAAPSDVSAFLEDYAFLAYGLLELYEATLEITWLDAANTLADELLKLFRDPDSGEFTLTGLDAEQMPARVPSDHDGVTPSAFAVTARVLVRLAWISGRPELLESASIVLEASQREIERNPLGHLSALQALSMLKAEPTIITLSGTVGSQDLADLLLVLTQQLIPHLAIRLEITEGPAYASICARSTCFPAVDSPEQLERLLAREGLCMLKQVQRR